MNYIDCKELNLYIFNLNQPIFDFTYNIFISKFNSEICVKYNSVKLLEVSEDSLRIEFLHSSNILYGCITQLDDKVKEEIILNGESWFGNNLNTDTINNMFKYSIKLPEKLPGFPTMEFKISENCGVFGVSGKRRMAIGKLKPNMEIEIGFSVSGVHFYKNRCNLVYCVNYIKVINNVCLMLEDLFGGNSDEENIEDEINTMLST